MGRELRRKEAKKNNNTIKPEKLDTSIKKSTIIKLIIFSTIILFVLYYTIAVFITKEINISWGNDNKTSETEEGSTENKILATNILNQKEETYYVYFYDFANEDASVSRAIRKAKETVYRVDTKNALNSNYITEEASNPNAKNLEELKVKNNTVIKVSNDVIIEYYEGSSAILELFK